MVEYGADQCDEYSDGDEGEDSGDVEEDEHCGFSDAAIGFVLVKIDIVVMLKKEDENGGKW